MVVLLVFAVIGAAAAATSNNNFGPLSNFNTTCDCSGGFGDECLSICRELSRSNVDLLYLQPMFGRLPPGWDPSGREARYVNYQPVFEAPPNLGSPPCMQPCSSSPCFWSSRRGSSRGCEPPKCTKPSPCCETRSGYKSPSGYKPPSDCELPYGCEPPPGAKQPPIDQLSSYNRPGHPDYTYLHPEVRRMVLATMPNIPYAFGNVLYYLKPSFGRYIMRKHMCLEPLLSSMDGIVLLKMLEYDPDLGEKISIFSKEWIQAVFGRFANPCIFLKKLPAGVRSVIVFKVPYLDRVCSHPTKAPGRAEKVAIDATKPTAFAAFVEDEIAAIESKIPLFRSLLSKMNMQMASSIRRIYGSLSRLFTMLPKKTIEHINSLLKSGMKVDKMKPSYVGDLLFKNSNDSASGLARQLFT